MFTKKQFEAVADILDANRVDLECVLDFSDMFAEDNDRFNRSLFVTRATRNIKIDAEQFPARMIVGITGKRFRD